jgi:hypothetical protein
MKPYARCLSQEDYDSALDLFRQFPEDIVHVAHSLKFSIKKVQTLWYRGIPEQGLHPIKDVLQDEQSLARVARATEDLSTRTEPISAKVVQSSLHRPHEVAQFMTRQDVIETRAEEGKMIKASRHNTIALMAVTSRLLETAIRKADQLEMIMNNEVEGQEPITFEQHIKFINACANLTKQAAEAADKNIQMERILLGEPTEILGVSVKQMTMEEATQTMRSAQLAFEKAKARGIIPQTVEVLVEDPSEVIPPLPKSDPT